MPTLAERNIARTKSPYDRLMKRVDKLSSPTGCWLWTGSKNLGGYGQFKWNSTESESTHRASWRIFMGKIPENIQVLHRCDVRHCVNPNHLFLGTNDDNHLDKAIKKRAKNQHSRSNMEVCLRGHTGEWRVTPNGTRYCRLCLKLRTKRLRTNVDLERNSG
jgi:hypothetical protein